MHRQAPMSYQLSSYSWWTFLSINGQEFRTTWWTANGITCGLCCQKQVSKAWISDCIQQNSVGCSYLFNPGPLTTYVKLWFAHVPGMPGTFSQPRRVSDPDIHHGTCVTHVPWCMPGSLTSGFLWSWRPGKRSRHSRRMRNLKFYISGKRPIPACDARVFIYKHSLECVYVVSQRNFLQFSRLSIGFNL